jgi:hypothetical protein
MTKVKRFGALLFALGVFAASVAPAALGDPPGPGDKQCRGATGTTTRTAHRRPTRKRHTLQVRAAPTGGFRFLADPTQLLEWAGRFSPPGPSLKGLSFQVTARGDTFA